MGYSHAVRHGVLKKVLPPESRSIAKVSQETGVNEQTIRNWLKQSKSGILPNEKKDSTPRSLTPKEKYQLVVEAAGIDDEHLGEFLRERGLHSEHLTIWDQELREMIDAKKRPATQGKQSTEKPSQGTRKRASAQGKGLGRGDGTVSA